ncbi:MAG: hypothetical protein WCO44_07570 [Bacteroidota bacterium]
MKFLKLFLFSLVLFFAQAEGKAQFSVSLNLGAPPMWGPSGVAEAHYYYLPDVEAFYDINASMFIYYGDGAWIHRSYLPARYKNYDLYGGYKVVMNDYHGNTPYTHFREYKGRYAKGYHGHPQKTIGERPGRGNQGENRPHETNHENRDNGGHDSHNSDQHGHDNGSPPGHDHDKKDNHGNDKGKNK